MGFASLNRALNIEHTISVRYSRPHDALGKYILGCLNNWWDNRQNVGSMVVQAS